MRQAIQPSQPQAPTTRTRCRTVAAAPTSAARASSLNPGLRALVSGGRRGRVVVDGGFDTFSSALTWVSLSRSAVPGPGSAVPNRRYRHGFVGTEKRERQKANRAKRQAEEAKAARNSAVKRNAVRWVIVAIAAVAAVVLIAWIGGAFDSSETTYPDHDCRSTRWRP